jgi:hypothetical protein
MSPGRSEIVFLQTNDSDMALRQDLNGSALPTFLPSASSRARISGAYWFTICCGKVACPPLTDLTGCYPGHEGYIQAFNESVTFLTAGYHYDSLWTLLSVGLSPTGRAAKHGVINNAA